MSTGTAVAIIIVAVVVIAVVAAVVLAGARRRRLRERFGPEYDRAVGQHDSRLKAESELAARERRVRGLEIRPLDPAARARYAERWAMIQEEFVNTPGQTVVEAHGLVIQVMNDRGYPTEDPRQITADLSVEHATTLDHYRTASAVADKARSDAASTEELRQAMLHYRALFVELLGTGGNEAESGGRDSSGAGRPAAATGARDAEAGTQAGRPIMEPDGGRPEAGRPAPPVMDPDGGGPGAGRASGTPTSEADPVRQAPDPGGGPGPLGYGVQPSTGSGPGGASAGGGQAGDRRVADEADAAEAAPRGRTAPPPGRL